MTNIEIVSYNPHHDGDTYLAGVIDCYKRSFSGPPWNESHICPGCKKPYGTEEMDLISPSLSCTEENCDGELTEFWPAEQVSADFINETREDPEAGKIASSWIALDGEQVIGICWGYTVYPRQLANKIGLTSLEANLLGHFGDTSKLVAYLDELAVLPEYRGQKLESLGGNGIAKALVRARHNDIFTREDVEISVVRTLREPATRVYEWYTNIGFKVIDSYPENPNRVILARKFLRVTQSCFTDGCLLESF